MPITRRTLMKTAAASVALSAFTRPTLAEKGRPGLVVALPAQPDFTDPVMANNTPTLRTLYNVYDALLRLDYNDNLKVVPALAQSWRRLDPTTLEFVLRPDVKFHDGSTMTADDVVFSLSEARRKGPEGKGATVAAQYQRTIDNVVAADAQTVRIITKAPDPALEKKLAAWSCQIVSKAAFEKAGSWQAWFQVPVGTGPYKIKENRKDVGLVLEAHDDYWGGRPPFERIEFRVVPESASRVNGLLAGDYDLISDLPRDQFDAIGGNDALDLLGGAILNMRILAIDTTAPWLSDPNIRRAMSLAIDRELIVKQLWADRIAVPNGAQYPIFGDVYLPEFPAVAHDPKRAAELVKASGYGGEPIPYRLLNNWYPNQVLTAQVLAEMWKAVGLNIALQPMENFSQVYQKPIGAVWDESIVPAWPDPTAMVWRQYGPGGGLNKLAIWNSPEYQEIGAKFEQSSDADARRKLQLRSLEIIADQVPFIILHSNGGFFAKKKTVAWAPYPALPMDFGPFNAATMRGI
jgi:peptide/nickel transport system substrate-binding protein